MKTLFAHDSEFDFICKNNNYSDRKLVFSQWWRRDPPPPVPLLAEKPCADLVLHVVELVPRTVFSTTQVQAGLGSAWLSSSRFGSRNFPVTIQSILDVSADVTASLRAAGHCVQLLQ